MTAFADVVAPGRAGAGPGEAGHRADQRAAADRPRGVRLRLRAVHAVVHQGAGRGGRDDERPADRGDRATSDDIEDIEEYVAREQAGGGDRPHRARGSPAPEPAGRTAAAALGQTAAMGRVIVVGAGVVGLSCARPAARGGPPGRRGGPGPAAGDDVGGGRRDLVPLPRLPAGPGAGLVARVVRRVRAARGRAPGRAACCRGHRGVAAPRRPDPWWRDAVPDLDRRPSLPRYGDGWTFSTPVVEMPVYLRWLAGRVRGARRHDHPAQPARRCPTAGPDVVVNCSGIGARLLAADPSVHRCRGRWCWSSRSGWSGGGSTAAGPTYVVPRSRDIVVGGTDVEGEWSRTPSPEVAARDPAPGARGWCPR